MTEEEIIIKFQESRKRFFYILLASLIPFVGFIFSAIVATSYPDYRSFGLFLTGFGIVIVGGSIVYRCPNCGLFPKLGKKSIDLSPKVCKGCGVKLAQNT